MHFLLLVTVILYALVFHSFQSLFRTFDCGHLNKHIMIYGKGAKERVVPVSPFLAKALLKYSRTRESYFKDVLHDKEFFLSRTGKKLTAEAVAKMLKKAADAVGVSKEIRVSPHTCRHTFAHLNLKNGIDLYTLSRLLGHESVSITQRYLEGITDEGVIRIARKTGVLENITR